MTKARDLADLISAGNPLADGAISVSEISDLTASAAELNQLDNTADLPDIRPSLLLDFANSKTLDPRITFTRGSTATYWDGKTTTKAEENLFKYSQEFDNAAWGKSANVTATANSATAPDGTTTADTFVENDTATDFYYFYQTVTKDSTARSYTFSTYAKQGSRSWAMITIYDGTNGNRYWFDLATVATGTTFTLGSGFSNISHSISDAGNGWCRLEINFTTLTGTSIINFVAPASADNTQTITGVVGQSAIYIWGAQVEQRSSATAYTATTTSPIVKYQPVLQTAASGEARFDHDPVTGESKGLLIEEARTNLVTYSEDFDQWSTPAAPTAATVTDDTIVSPDGNITGATVDFTASDNHPAFISATVSLADGSSMTNSLFIKYGGGNLTSYKLQAFSTGTSSLDGYAVITFNSSGEITSVTTNANVTSVGYEDVGNGWYRVHAVQNNTTGGTQTSMRLSIGRGASDTGFIYIWGAQVEQGSFPTSYIPTSGSTVTRAVDSASITGGNFTDWFSQEEGTFYSEHQSVASINQRIYAANDNGSNNNTIQGLISTSGGAGVNFEVRALGNGEMIKPGSITPVDGQHYKLAGAYAANDGAASRDGGTVGTDNGLLIPAVSTFHIGSSSAGSGQSRSTIKKIAYYPKRLPNATLQAMTEA